MNSLDNKYKIEALRAVDILLQGANGDFQSIPDSYAQHLQHEYSEGNISLLSAINKFSYSSDLEDWQIEECLETLMDVDPNDWPNPEDISTVSLDAVYEDYSHSYTENYEDFAELSDMEYGSKVAKMFKNAIESVFGSEVESVGTSNGKTPNKNNRFCRDKDSFKGTFVHDKKKFEFELCKDDKNEWHLAYTLEKSSQDKLFKPSNKKIQK